MISNWKSIKCIFCNEKYCYHDLRKKGNDYDFCFNYKNQKFIGQLINKKFSLYNLKYLKNNKNSPLINMENISIKDINKEFIIKIINNLIFL